MAHVVASSFILQNVPVNVTRTTVEIRSKFLLDDINIPHKQKREVRSRRLIVGNDTKGKQ